MKSRRPAASLVLALLLTAAGGAEPGGGLALYFPPVPPALGTAITKAPLAAPALAGEAAPLELAPYISDPFYGPLSASLGRHEVGTETAFALQSYQTTKAALQTELRARLDFVREAAPEVRIAELRTFAAEQTPRLVQLEATAEGLRESLAETSSAARECQRWLQDSAGERAAKRETAAFEAQTELMLAYFATGPSPAQRRLLRELAGEVREPISSAAVWSFAPEGARVSLEPSDPVTPELRQLIADYQSLDRKRKRAVRDLALSARRADPQSWTSAASADAALERAVTVKAEEIRRIIVKFKDPAMLPQVPTVPQSMAAQVARHRADKTALQHALLQRVEAAKKAGPPETAPDRIREAITAFMAENQAKYAALEQSRADLLGQLEPAAGGPHDTAGGSAESLTHTFNRSLQQLKSFWEYRDYQAAVFQPGLSPEQRRLLFDEALIKLGLPLPGAVHPVGLR